MSLLQEHQIETSVYLCSFECLIRQANIAMKFPCTYFVQWRTINSKASARTNRHPPKDNQVVFEERIELQVEMLFDHGKLEFLRRETIVELFLVSKSRPDQNKLVGRVNIDLGKVANVGMYAEPTEFRLNFCSIQGSLIMQFRPLEQQLTTLTIQDLDKSSFIDFISQSTMKNQGRNQSMVLSRHENHSMDKDRNGRSEIRGRSPGSPKGILKSTILNKSNHFRTDQQVRDSFNPKETKPQISKPPIEQSQDGKTRVGLVNSKVNFNTKNLFDQEEVPPQTKNNEAKRPSQPILLDVIPQDDIITSQTIDLHNILKTSSSPIFQTHQLNIPNEVREAYGSLTFGNKDKTPLQIHQSGVKSSKEQAPHAETQKLQSQVSKLLDENELLFQEKERSDKRYEETASALERYKIQFSELQQQMTEKDKALHTYSSEGADKDKLIQQLQTEIRSIYQANKRQETSEVQNLKAKLSLYEALTKQLNDNTKASAASYQKKLASYEQIISQLEKDKEQVGRLKEDSENRLQAYVNSSQSLKTRLEDLQAENNQLLNSLQFTRKQLEQHTDNVLKQSVDLQQQAKDRNELTMEVQRLNQELDNAMLKYDQVQKELGELQGKYLELESLYDEQVSANQQLQLKMQELQATRQHEVGQMPQHGQIILNTSEVVETIQPEPNKEQLARLRQQSESLANQVQFLKSHTEMNEQAFHSTLQGLRHQKESLLEQIFNLQTNMASTASSFQTKISQLIATNAQLLSDNESLKGEIAHLSRQLYENEWMENEKALQEENEYLREQARVVEAQVELYEKELMVLKDEIIRIRETRDGKSDKTAYEEMLARLNGNLQEQINQNTQLSQTIVRYMQKEAKMKETLAVLERESKEIFSLVQEKQQNEETYQKAIEQLQVELLALRNQQPSPTSHSKQSSPQRIFEDNPQLVTTIRQQQTIDRQKDQLAKLNEELTKINQQLMQLSLQCNEEKARMESEVSNLTQSLILAEADSKREEETFATKCKEYQRTIKNKDIQIDIMKSRARQRENAYRTLESEVNRLRSSLQEIEQLKFNLQSTNNEKDIRIIQLQDQVQALNKNINAPRTPLPPPPQPSQQSLSHLGILQELKERLLQKTLNSDWDSLLQSILDRSMNGEQTGRLLNLQQKSRLLSKQLQKMKAQLLKSEWRNQQQKVSAMGLFKKCESIVAQLIAAAEALNQNQSSFL